MTKLGDDNDLEQTLLHSRHVALSMQECKKGLHDLGAGLVELYKRPCASKITVLTQRVLS